METTDTKTIIQTFVLDDDYNFLNTIKELFELDAEISDYRLFANQNDFFEALNEQVKVAVIDYYLQVGITGLEVMKRILEQNPKCRIIVISASDRIDLDAVININNLGPFPFLNKLHTDFSELLIGFVKKAVKLVRQEEELYNSIMNIRTKHA